MSDFTFVPFAFSEIVLRFGRILSSVWGRYFVLLPCTFFSPPVRSLGGQARV